MIVVVVTVVVVVIVIVAIMVRGWHQSRWQVGHGRRGRGTPKASHNGGMINAGVVKIQVMSVIH